MDDVLLDNFIKALWKKDSQNAIASIKAIGEPALPSLMIALKKDDFNAEFVAYENGALRQAIIEIGEPAFEKLIEALSPESDMVRAAAKTLRRWGDKRAVEYMIVAMFNDDIDINGRCYIIETLGYFQDPKAFEPLKTALKHQNEFIRSFAARALAEYGDVSVIPSIFEALQHVNRNWWNGTTEGIGEIIKVVRDKCKKAGLEAEFGIHLKEMELCHPKMVADYKEWIKYEYPVFHMDIPGAITGVGRAIIFFHAGTRPLFVKIKSNAPFYISAQTSPNSDTLNITKKPFEGTIHINNWCNGLTIYQSDGEWTIEVTEK